jgi:hypothetical protein
MRKRVIERGVSLSGPGHLPGKMMETGSCRGNRVIRRLASGARKTERRFLKAVYSSYHAGQDIPGWQCDVEPDHRVLESPLWQEGTCSY